MNKNAVLVLEDGLTFSGYAFGAKGETFGEVVFNTSMTGYQEILTDPSYAGQIVILTYPEIGNYGVNSEDYEAFKPFVEGFIIREASKIYSNWRAEGSLESFLKNYGIVGIEGIDTRMLVKHIRTKGAMKGGISSRDLDKKSFLEKVRNSPGLIGRDLVKKVTLNKIYKFKNKESKNSYKVVALDFGIKKSILKYLAEVDCEIEVVPANTSAEKILVQKPEGIFLSNGPGDPAAISYAIESVKKLLGKKPIFGICLGHQILGLALGGKTYKLKFGHHGGNHPVKNLLTGRIEITTQNHGFAVAEKSIQGPNSQVQKNFGRIEITHINLNDGTVEGLRCLDIPAFSVQYHPEASPGPHDSRYLFKQFKDLMKEFRDSPNSKERWNNV